MLMTFNTVHVASDAVLCVGWLCGFGFNIQLTSVNMNVVGEFSGG